MNASGLNLGVLNPATAQIFGSTEGLFVLARGVHGEGGCPYVPEFLQRRNNTFAAALGITLRWTNPPNPLTEPWDVKRDLFECHRWGCHAEDEGILPLEELEVVFIKMPRPAAPQGSEWNAPGGVLKIGEDAGGGMTREWKEELLGMQVLATTVLPGVQQYASGSFREWYQLGFVLAIGEPKPSPKEKAQGVICVPLKKTLAWIEEQNGRDPRSLDYCGVDGKIEHAFLKLARLMQLAI